MALDTASDIRRIQLWFNENARNPRLTVVRLSHMTKFIVAFIAGTELRTSCTATALEMEILLHP